MFLVAGTPSYPTIPTISTVYMEKTCTYRPRSTNQFGCSRMHKVVASVSYSLFVSFQVSRRSYLPGFWRSCSYGKTLTMFRYLLSLQNYHICSTSSFLLLAYFHIFSNVVLSVCLVHYFCLLFLRQQKRKKLGVTKS